VYVRGQASFPDRRDVILRTGDGYMSNQIPIPHDVQQMLEEQMAIGNYRSQDEVLRDALKALDEKRQVIVEEDPEVIAGIRRGLEDMRAGRYQSLADFDAEFRAKHKIAPNG
jgi:Arc/MetJ-type ribon-helix-helix transcriptional regulator